MTLLPSPKNLVLKDQEILHTKGKEIVVMESFKHIVIIQSL